MARRQQKRAVGCCAVGALLLALLVARAVPLLTDQSCRSWLLDKGGFWYAGQLAIEAGRGPERQRPGERWPLYDALRFLAAIASGRVYAPAACWPLPGLLARYTEGPERRFCRGALDSALMAPGYEVNAERGTAEAFLGACGAELEALRGEERELLEPLWRGGGDAEPFHFGLLGPADASMVRGFRRFLVANRSDVASRRPGADAVLDAPYPGPKLSRSELEGLLSASLRYSAAGAGLAAAAVERELGARLPGALEFWQQLDVRGLEPLGRDLPAVGRALARGGLVRFDARALLPRGAFNVTAASLAEAEGEAARRIAVLSESPLPPRSLRGLAEELAGAALPLGFGQLDAHHLRGFVNLRRLPRLAARLPEDVPARLGLAEDVLQTVSVLWLGPITAGAWSPAGFSGPHYDAQANVYVQLAGEADVVLVPPEYTDLLDWTGANSFGLASGAREQRASLEASDVLPRVPFVLAHLRPGDGLTLPSRTYHYFMAQGPERVALNYFFHPRWRRMQYNSTDLLSRRAPAALARDKVAILAAQRVWRETGKAVFTCSSRFELI